MQRSLVWALTTIILVSAAVFFFILPGMVDKKMNRVAEHKPYTIHPRAQALHDGLLIGDWHADPTLWDRDLSQRHDHGHIDLPRMREGNHALQVFTTVTKSPSGLNYEHNDADSRDNITLLAVSQRWPIRTWQNLTQRALYQASRLHALAEEHPDAFMLVRSREELNQLRLKRQSGSKIVGGILGTEGSHALEGELSNIDVLFGKGFRVMSLHHFFDNRLGGSLHGSSKAGLTDFGREVAKKIDGMPIVLDLSHSSEAVVREVLEIVKHPVIISHGGIKGHCDSPRNLPDELMQDIAAKGGLLGVGLWDAASCDASPTGIAQAINAAITLMGEDHVSLGSDFDGAVTTTMDSSELAALTQALLDQNLSEQTIRKVMGENMLRILQMRLP